MAVFVIHWSLILIIVFAIFGLILTFALLRKLRVDTKYDVCSSEDGMTYVIVDLWRFKPTKALDDIHWSDKIGK